MLMDIIWQLLFLAWIFTLILAYSTGNQNSQPYPEKLSSKSRQLWHSNFEDYRAEASVGFENNTITNVTVQLGATAYLHCRVKSLAERTLGVGEIQQVSWIRKRDWHILSSGVYTYTNDERFQILHAEGSDDWTLQIKYVQKRDNGTYECQISNSQGLLSHFANLQIVVPEATIQGSRIGEHHVDVGSVIDLICVIDKSPTPPQYVFWYHNDRMINYDTARGGISVETIPGLRTHSRLTIQNTNDADSGNYTCSASNTESASIYVFISEVASASNFRAATVSHIPKTENPFEDLLEETRTSKILTGDNVDAILMRKSCAMCITISQLRLLVFLLFVMLLR